MAFCTNCGAPSNDADRFCTKCGTPHPTAAAPPVGAPSSFLPGPIPAFTEKLDYTIQGDNLQLARLHLQAGQEVYGEAGRMIYKTGNVYWDTRMTGASLGDKIIGAIRRKISGESIFLTYFKSQGTGEVGFAGAYPGKVQAFDLAPGQSIIAQRDAFLCAQPSVRLGIAFVRRLGAGFFGGEGFILQKFTGPGLVFLHAGGDVVDFHLAAGESIQIDTGCIVCFDESVDYDIQFAGGIKTMMFGGEGIFLANMTGPGRVLVQSMTLGKMRREIAPHDTDKDSHKGLHAITDIFTNND